MASFASPDSCCRIKSISTSSSTKFSSRESSGGAGTLSFGDGAGAILATLSFGFGVATKVLNISLSMVGAFTGLLFIGACTTGIEGALVDGAGIGTEGADGAVAGIFSSSASTHLCKSSNSSQGAIWKPPSLYHLLKWSNFTFSTFLLFQYAMTASATACAVSEMYWLTVSALRLKLWLQHENITMRKERKNWMKSPWPIVWIFFFPLLPSPQNKPNAKPSLLLFFPPQRSVRPHMS
mmetsp:Transcript_4519/g.6571  ORF Transcript_4519/g.6571 Transcript_4519/m.6571 type:complete len:237 (+) Transcript_4519:818-1528(+)